MGTQKCLMVGERAGVPVGRFSRSPRRRPSHSTGDAWVLSSDDTQEGRQARWPVSPASLLSADCLHTQLLTGTHRADFFHEFLANTREMSAPGGQGLSLVCRTFCVQAAGSAQRWNSLFPYLSSLMGHHTTWHGDRIRAGPEPAPESFPRNVF